jgi:hypothetical protein
MAVPDDEFNTMLAQVRRLRKRVDDLGSVTGDMIKQGMNHFRDAQPADYLTPAQRELADEIVGLLEDPRLSVLQAGQLERAFFT